MQNKFNNDGFFVVRNCFEEQELKKLDTILNKFHKSWIEDNPEFYNNNAINSAYLTDKVYLDNNERFDLFNFISCDKIISVLSEVIPEKPCFMNTQLFFDPVNKQQKNYWHRDIQYLDISEDEQKALLTKDNTQVIHFRVPLKDEPGIELVPGTHKHWDSGEEYCVRKELNDKKNFDSLSTGRSIELRRGDMLVFSAKMIHRGLYGRDRLSLDILYCDNNAELLEYAKLACYPEPKLLSSMKNSFVFSNALRLVT